MKKWGYCGVEAHSFQEMLAGLEQQGKEGWECINFVKHGIFFRAILKREVPEPLAAKKCPSPASIAAEDQFGYHATDPPKEPLSKATRFFRDMGPHSEE